MSSNPTSRGTKRQNLVFTRFFDVPVERTWRAWPDPEQVKRWGYRRASVYG
jgi:uncharacterized protein YndB with AHSA1/START domain